MHCAVQTFNEKKRKKKADKINYTDAQRTIEDQRNNIL